MLRNIISLTAILVATCCVAAEAQVTTVPASLQDQADRIAVRRLDVTDRDAVAAPEPRPPQPTKPIFKVLVSPLAKVLLGKAIFKTVPPIAAAAPVFKKLRRELVILLSSI